MIRKLLLSTVALAAISGSAFAADLPARRAPPVYVPPAPVFTFTGFYLGAQVGYAFGNDRVSNFGPVPGVFRYNGNTYQNGTPQGIIGGVHAGYNLSTQGLPIFGGFTGAGGVIGVEADVNPTDYRSTNQTIGFGARGVGPAFTSNTSVKNDVDGSVRGRLGIAVDRALFYATGGVAIARFEEFNQVSALGASLSDNRTHTRIGYTVGGGFEYAITTAFLLRAEYRYTDYGSFTETNLYAPGSGFSNRHRLTQNRVQVGFDYKFENPIAAMPVVARY